MADRFDGSGADPGLDRLRPIDPGAPVSGHHAGVSGGVASLAPEHDWDAARERIFPVLRPVGMVGLSGDRMVELIRSSPTSAHTQPLLGEGLGGLPVAYALTADRFDILVNGEHLLSWEVDPGSVHQAAMANLAAWSAGAPWSDETDGDRRLLSSDTGDGWDAARILLPDVRQMLADELGHSARVLVGLPERHLLLAGSLRPEDVDFAALFREFVLEHSGGADEPIDRRVFELAGGELSELAAE